LFVFNIAKLGYLLQAASNLNIWTKCYIFGARGYNIDTPQHAACYAFTFVLFFISLFELFLKKI